MSITFNKNSKIFHLKSKTTSYVIKILETGHLVSLYWGKKIKSDNLDYAFRMREFGSFLANTDNINEFMLEATCQEYPSYGSTDLRSPSIELKFLDGSRVSDFRFDSFSIYDGKKTLDGLPSTYCENNNEVQSLDIILIDKLKNIKLTLSYNMFYDYDVLTRSVSIHNLSDDSIEIKRLLSANFDFNNDNYDILHLSGSWAKERHIVRSALRSGSQSIESRRGSSSHAQNPFLGILSKGTTENTGDAYGFSLVYSGNFLANAEVDMYSNTRVQIGINPFDFSWKLEGNEIFQAPEAVLVYSSNGINGLSHIYHDIYCNRLCRGKFRNELRPILINNWEATYFDFDEKKIKDLAIEAKSLGIELLVLDDGWFGNRNDDKSSLGDWFVNEDKIKGGLNKLVNEVNEIGLKFGLWFEPEMVSPISKLYNSHPDWCIHVKGRTRSEARNQLILNLGMTEVQDYIIEKISDILDSSNIEYVKWDMNRNMTEIGSFYLPAERQKETSHRYMLGLYKVLETITSKYPNVLFESCSGGGGRFDPGMLYYMPQVWTSDNTDAIERLKIQFGTSIVYPNVSMGCHVSAVPNHQVSRITPLQTRGIVAMSGNFGYELDITALSFNDKEIIKNQIETYKSIQATIQFGTLHRLLSPFESNIVAWMYVAKDNSQVVVNLVKQFAEPNESFKSLKLQGLDADAIYEIVGENIYLGGDELMYLGLNIPFLNGDFAATSWILKKVN